MKSFDEFCKKHELKRNLDYVELAWEEGQQSKQAEVDELRKQIDATVKWVEENMKSIPLEYSGYTTEEYVDADDLLDILKGDQS